jgi:HEAT repeat protein/PBS lyase HEAT-like repeat-containing protein
MATRPGLRRFLGIVALLVACAASASPQEAAKDEVATQVAALASPDPVARSAAIDALARIEPSSVRALVDAAARTADDHVWDGIRIALRRASGPAPTDALSRMRAEWPESCRTRLDRLVTALRKASPPALPELTPSPPDVASAVAETLRGYENARVYAAHDPSVDKLEKLGRPAVGALVGALRERMREERTFDVVAEIASDGLARLLGDGDAALVTALLAEGCDPAAKCVGRLRAEDRASALILAVESDRMGHETLRALSERRDDPRIAPSLLGWLERNPTHDYAGSVAVELAESKYDDAAPAVAAAAAFEHPSWTRCGLAEALAKFGSPAGVETLIAMLGDETDPNGRVSAGQALNDVASLELLRGTYAREDRPAEWNLDEALRGFKAWWAEGKGARFDAESRAWVSTKDDGLPRSPEAVVRSVASILGEITNQHWYSSSNDQVPQLVALGHDAVPALLRVLRGASHQEMARMHAAADALVKLVQERDIPLVARLLEEGHLDAAKCLDKLRGDASRDALLRAPAAGFLDHDVLDALEAYRTDPAVQAAVLSWLENHAQDNVWTAGRAARWLGDAGAVQAVPALRQLLETNPRAGIAIGLAQLGGREGVEWLVGWFCDVGRSGEIASGPDLSDRRQQFVDAGEALNTIIGRRVWSGHMARSGITGNVREAAEEVFDWWAESSAKLRFDENGRRWTTRAAESGFAWQEPTPEMSATVAAAIEAIPESNIRFRGSSGAACDTLVALGHDAVPALAQYLRRHASNSRSHRLGARFEAIAGALARLRTDADVPLLCALLAEGHIDAARALIGMRDPRARDALLAAVRTGCDDFDLIPALSGWESDPATWVAVCEGLRRADHGFFLAGFLAGRAPDCALPALRSLAAAPSVSPWLQLSALTAMVRLGDVTAIPRLVEFVAHDPGSSDGHGGTRTSTVGIEAAEVLNRVVGERIHPADDEAARFSRWWDENSARLRFDRAHRVFTVAPPDGTRVIDGDPAAPMAARVAAVYAHSAAYGIRIIGGGDPDAKALAALGRDAIPYLVAEVRSGLPWQQKSSLDEERDLAAEALCSLFTDDDRDLAVSLVREGRLGLAPYFGTHPSPAGRDALLDVLRRGFATSQVFTALRPYLGEDAVVDAVLAWTRRYATTDDAWDWCLPDALAAAPADGKAPGVRVLGDRTVPAAVRALTAVALAAEGVVEAIPVLIDAFENPAGLDEQSAWRVGEALNDVAGERIVEIAARMPIRVSGFPSELGGGRREAPSDWHDLEDPASRAKAAARLRDWWQAKAERLRFDPGSKKWSVAPAPPK